MKQQRNLEEQQWQPPQHAIYRWSHSAGSDDGRIAIVEKVAQICTFLHWRLACASGHLVLTHGLEDWPETCHIGNLLLCSDYLTLVSSKMVSC